MPIMSCIGAVEQLSFVVRISPRIDSRIRKNDIFQHVICRLAVYMLQSIFRISQSLGMTEPTSQSIRLPDATSQY